MIKFYSCIIMAIFLFGSTVTTAKAESVRLLKRQTFYGDAQGDLGDAASRTIDYLYNAQNVLIRSIERSLSTEGEVSLRTWETTHYNKYEYDANGNLTETSSLTYGVFDYGEWGAMESKDSVFYEYNNENLCTKETHKYVIYEYTYDDQGRRLTSSKWNINSITGDKSNDLLETYSDFNAQGNPCTITATSPSGKSWNEYTGIITYDENGRKISKKHFDSDGMMTVDEEWTYEGDYLKEHISWNVLDGQDMGGTKEIFTPVDGDWDKVILSTYGSDDKGGWTQKFGGTDCLYEYAYFDGEKCSPTLTAQEAEGVNNVELQFVMSEESNMSNIVTLYRNGQIVAEEVTGSYVDECVKNGDYEYIALTALNSSNIAKISLQTELPAVTNLHIVSTRKDFSGNTYVTIGWTNPDADEALGYQKTSLYFEGMKTEDVSTDDQSATEIEVNFGNENEKVLFVQTTYNIGRANSELFVANLAEFAAGINSPLSTYHFPLSTFNLSGQRVANPTKGIYIKNGRKIVK